MGRVIGPCNRYSSTSGALEHKVLGAWFDVQAW